MTRSSRFSIARITVEPATPPSMLAVGLLLQISTRSRMKKPSRRAHFDIQCGSARCPRRFTSIRQEHAATVPLATGHPREGRRYLSRSRSPSKSVGYLKSRKLKIAFGHHTYLRPGSVKDTYNLLADGIVKLMSALARREEPQSRYLGRST